MRLTHRDNYGRWFSDGSTASLRLGNPSENYPAILWGDAVNKLAAYEEAEEQGLLVRLPCKVGDTLYAPTRNIVSEFRIIRFVIGGYDKHYLWVNWHLEKGITGNFRIDVIPAEDIGKTVFLTREEAEAALKGGQDDGT